MIRLIAAVVKAVIVYFKQKVTFYFRMNYLTQILLMLQLIHQIGQNRLFADLVTVAILLRFIDKTHRSHRSLVVNDTLGVYWQID